MCDFTHCSVASTAEHSHVYGKTWREGSSNPLIYCTSDLVCLLSLSLSFSLEHANTHAHTHAHTRTHAHKHTHTQTPQHVISPPAQTSHPPPPSQFRLILPSPLQLRHPRETNSDCSSTPSWHVGQGRWSPFRFSATTSLPPSLPCRCPLAASQHFLNMPGVTAG